MSHFATPFIVVNLGCEMLYVIEQRLNAQDIASGKSERVLTDIATVLLHPKLLEELFIPQPVATHNVIKQLLQDISGTSIMKLDDYSMGKLWDLMTMIFKWQISIAANQNIFDITRRHLINVASIVPKNFPKSIIEGALRKFESLIQRLTDDDYNCLKNTLLLWFSEYHTKISVLLRLGLQKKDGTFSMPTTIKTNILQNLGENIYKYDHKRNSVEEYESRYSDTNEITYLLAPIESDHSKETVFALQLPIEFNNVATEKKVIKLTKDVNFESIATNIKNKSCDLNFIPDIPNTTQEDLLKMMEEL